MPSRGVHRHLSLSRVGNLGGDGEDHGLWMRETTLSSVLLVVSEMKNLMLLTHGMLTTITVLYYERAGGVTFASKSVALERVGLLRIGRLLVRMAHE